MWFWSLFSTQWNIFCKIKNSIFRVNENFTDVYSISKASRTQISHGLLFQRKTEWSVKPRVNGRNIVGCYMLRPFAYLVACCWKLLRKFDKPIKLLNQQLPTFRLFHDRRSVAQQCWIRLHGSSTIVGATYAHYSWFTKSYGLYLSHDALQVPTFYGQQCWELLRPFARSLRQSVMWVRG